jgi:hypothetical protein
MRCWHQPCVADDANFMSADLDFDNSVIAHQIAYQERGV